MPTTTKTRPAQSPADKTTATREGNAAELFERGRALINGAPVKDPGQAARNPVPVIRRSIDLITDAVSEMLTTGTADSCLDKLLTASITHIARRMYERGIGTDNQDAISKGIEWDIKRNYQNWKQDIIATWRHNRRESPAAIEPATLTERIRLNGRDELEGLLESFIGRATPEEIRFLMEVMRAWESHSYIDPTHSAGEILIGEAFESELGRRDVSFITVPGRMIAQVTAYINALSAVEDKAA